MNNKNYKKTKEKIEQVYIGYKEKLKELEKRRFFIFKELSLKFDNYKIARVKKDLQKYHE